jgi:tetratricopeptide (TPR) repeat protein
VAEVMLALPDARLRWQCKSFGDADVTADMIARFAKLGISADRLTLLGSVSREAYFVAHHEVDVILDTFPYPGGTTTCEALWMGVPTLTLAGDSLIARQGASMLSAAGLVDWMVETKTDYLNATLAHCSDLHKLAKLRSKLRAQVLASPLFDAERFAKNMEIALWDIWHENYPVVDVSNVVTDVEPPNNEDHYKTSTIDAYEKKMRTNQNRNVKIVSATRYSESDFWNKSALGISLKRHLKQNSDMSVSVAFNNTHGLSEVFNQVIEQDDSETILVFVHDDVWIDEANLVDTLITGLEHFDVIGVAGNKRRVPNQPAWAFIDNQFTWDQAINLSGRVAHGKEAFGNINDYGVVPAECELMDGVFLATKKSTLINSGVKFDPQFDFHFYDLDFCRSARLAGLKLGTWLVSLTHQSGGAFGSVGWVNKYQLYLNKWENTSNQNLELQEAINDVLILAIEHYHAGRIDQAELLFTEILNIQPRHVEANYNLGLIELQVKGVSVALAKLLFAVKAQPENERYWVSFIDALIKTGAIDSAVDALELGQKYGLKRETAQSIARKFVELIDQK